jgi:hypothetical protein
MPLLDRFGLPADTSYDLLLCALYYRTFIADRSQDERMFAEAQAAASPFGVSAASPYPGQRPYSGQALPAPMQVPPAPLPQEQMVGAGFGNNT